MSSYKLKKYDRVYYQGHIEAKVEGFFDKRKLVAISYSWPGAGLMTCKSVPIEEITHVKKWLKIKAK